MKLSKLPYLLGALFFLQCQNLFNPSGVGTSDDLSATGHLSYCESLLRKGQNQDAAAECKLALQQDSTLSLAYYSLGKATLRRFNVNPTIFASLAIKMQNADTEDNGAVVAMAGFLDSLFLKDTTLTTAITTLANTLQPFVLRDSLQQLYKEMKSPDTSKSPSAAQVLFTSQFNAKVISNAGDPTIPTSKQFTYTDKHFPLLDGKISAKRIEPELIIATTINAIEKLLSIKKLFGTLPVEDLIEQFSSGELNLDSIKVDSANVEQYNKLLEGATTDLSSISGLAPDILNSNDSAAPSESEVQGTIDSLGNTVAFYKIGDALDNDGDGCIDEEIRDGIDNDGDGIIDEDTKLSSLSALDNIDNDKNGSVDESNETTLTNNRFGFATVGFMKDSLNMDRDYRYQVAQYGSDFTKITLQDRIDKIGGCWPNYK